MQTSSIIMRKILLIRSISSRDVIEKKIKNNIKRPKFLPPFFLYIGTIYWKMRFPPYFVKTKYAIKKRLFGESEFFFFFFVYSELIN